MPFEAGNKLARGGSRPGSGPKPDQLKQELQALLAEAVSRDRRKDILEMMMFRALSGDAKCAAFLFDRMYGKPVQHLEIATEETSGPPPVDLSRLTAEELAVLERLMRKAAIDGADGEQVIDLPAESGGDPRAAIAP